MHTVGIILNNTTSSKCLSPNVCLYKDLVTDLSPYKHVVIALQLDVDSFLFLDIRKLLNEQAPLKVLVPSKQDTSDRPSFGTASDNALIEVEVTSWELFDKYVTGLESEFLHRYLTVAIAPRLMQADVDRWVPCPFYSNIETQLRIVGVENTFGIDVGVGNHADPYTIVKSIEAYYTPDVVITNTGRSDIDFNNTIPIINGSVFYPEVWTNFETKQPQMFALNAGQWIVHSNWFNNKIKTVPHIQVPNTVKVEDEIIEAAGATINEYSGGEAPQVEHSVNYNKDIILIDFSSIGTIDKYKLTDCLNGRVSGSEITSVGVTQVDPKKHPSKAWLKGNIERPISSNYYIEFTLPEGSKMGTPIVCIGGRLFFEHNGVQIQQDGDTIWIRLTINRDVLEQITLSNLQWFGKQISGTTMVEADPKVLLDRLFTEQPYNNGTPEDVYRTLNDDLSVPFVIILHTDKTIVTTRTRPKMKIGPDKLLFPPEAGGLLYNRATHEIVDYTRIPYASGMLVETKLQRPLNALQDIDPNKMAKPQIGFEWNDFVSREKYVKFNIYDKLRDISNFELIDFAYMEN